MVDVTVMLMPNHPIFRQNAVKHYMQNRQKDTLPRFISLPIALFLWALLGLLLVVGLLAWYEQVPAYISGNGVVLNAKYVPQQNSQGAVAVAFFAIGQSNHLHVGQIVSVHVGTSTQSLRGTVLSVDPAVSPDIAVSRYGLDAPLITQPSALALIKLEDIAPSLYAGSTLTIDVRVGSHRIISLLPGIGRLFGE
jgi:hypothetical protein